jgi:hypothetical protein
MLTLNFLRALPPWLCISFQFFIRFRACYHCTKATGPAPKNAGPEIGADLFIQHNSNYGHFFSSSQCSSINKAMSLKLTAFSPGASKS